MERIAAAKYVIVNPLMGTLKLQSNGPLYSNMVIGTLAVDGWVVTLWYSGPAQSSPGCTTVLNVTFGIARRGLGGLLSSFLIAVLNVTNSPPVNGQCTNFILFDVAS